MARDGRLFLQLDTSYLDDDKIVEVSPMATLIDIAGMLKAKQLQTDGRLTRTQFTLIATRFGTDIAPILDELVEADLWCPDGSAYVRSAWSDWNDSAADIAAMSRGGTKGNHLRWHRKQPAKPGICSICDQERSGTDSPPESGGDIAPNPREDQTTPDANEDQTTPDHASTFTRESIQKVQAVIDELVRREFKPEKCQSGNLENFRSGIEKTIRREKGYGIRELVGAMGDLSVQEIADKVQGKSGRSRRSDGLQRVNGSVVSLAPSLGEPQ